MPCTNTLLFSTSKSELLAVERQVKVGMWSQKCNLLFSNPEISRWKHWELVNEPPNHWQIGTKPIFLVVHRQLNRWPCHWLTDWLTHSFSHWHTFWFLNTIETLETFLTYLPDLSTWPTYVPDLPTWPIYLTYLPELPTWPTYLNYLPDLPTWPTYDALSADVIKSVRKRSNLHVHQKSIWSTKTCH